MSNRPYSSRVLGGFVLVLAIGLWPAMWFRPLVRNHVEPRTTGFRIDLNRDDATVLGIDGELDV